MNDIITQILRTIVSFSFISAMLRSVNLLRGRYGEILPGAKCILLLFVVHAHICDSEFNC